MDSTRQVEACGSTRSSNQQRHEGTEKNGELLVFSVPPCLGGSTALKVAEGRYEGANAPALVAPAKTVRCRRHRAAYTSTSKRDQYEDTRVFAACGRQRAVTARKEIRRILYGKAPVVRLRTQPHLAADDDHPAGKDENSLCQRRTVAIGLGLPRGAGYFAAGATGKAMER